MINVKKAIKSTTNMAQRGCDILGQTHVALVVSDFIYPAQFEYGTEGGALLLNWK